ncbi:SH3 domain-containing protein [bacterium]|nr:SH3 domain-containing protein [bacterium]
MLRKIFISLGVLSLVGCATQQIKPYTGPQLLPINESQVNPSFASFLDEFRLAIENKNAGWVIAHLEEKVWSSFGGDGGIEEFIEHYKLREPDSKFWGIVKTAFDLGGTFGHIREYVSFEAPYVFARFPGEYDAFLYSAVITPDAPMRELPMPDAKVIAQLPYAIVQTGFLEEHGQKEVNGYLKIKTVDGQTGWMKKELLRSPIDYRIGIKQVGDEWTIAFLVAGD